MAEQTWTTDYFPLLMPSKINEEKRGEEREGERGKGGKNRKTTKIHQPNKKGVQFDALNTKT
jgi:hypothetical protein